MLEAHLLGRFDILLDGKLVEIPSRPAQSLLAFLLINHNLQHRREKLSGTFWPDASEENARRSLRQALWHIRRALEPATRPYLRTDDLSITLILANDDWVDAMVVDRDLPAAQPIQALIETATAYHGELLPGFYEDWVVLERERLQAVFERRMDQLIDQMVAERRWEDVLAWSERWISLGSTPEAAFRALMIAHHSLGSSSAVAATYQRCGDALERALGIPPSDATRSLYQNLLHEATAPSKEPKPPQIPPPLPETPAVPQEEGAADLPPYKGLQSFEEEDTGLFYGRESLTAHLLQRLESLADETKLIAVVGPSGCGKSSLVRAGLIPALRHQPETTPDEKGPGADAARWDIHLIVPTAFPLASLAASLTRDSESVSAMATLLDDMTGDPRSLSLFLMKRRVVSGRGPSPDCVLLVIDQFEELFTLCREETERQAFINNLLHAANEGSRVVLTLRADFYAQCAAYAGLRSALAANQEYIGPMSTPELRRAIEEPARAGGWVFEPGLVDLILRDIGVDPGGQVKAFHTGEPGALPLLSHALLETWMRRQGRTLTLAGYAEAGGVWGAVARTAESTYTRLSPEEQRLARAIFLRLTELGEDGGSQTTPIDTRRRVTLEELIPYGENRSKLGHVLEVLTAARLVTANEGALEVAHEALIREWPTLRRWLAEDREGLRLHRRLTEAAQAWEALDREPGELYRGVRLAQALEWSSFQPRELNALEQEFLDASRVWAEREESEREAQRLRELEAARRLAEAEANRAAEQVRSNNRLRWFAAGLGIFLLAAVILGGFFLQQRNRADAQTKLATSRELAASAVSNLGVDPERSILLALSALSAQDTLEAEDALHQAVQTSRLRRTFQLQGIWGFQVVFSPDGARLAASSGGPNQPLTTDIWDAASGKHLLSLPGAIAASFWPDAGRLATIEAGDQGTTQVHFWNANTGQMLSTTILAHSFNDQYGEFDPGWTRIAENLGAGTTIVSDLSSGKLLYRLGVPGATPPRAGAAFSPDGARLAVTVGNVTRMYDAATGNELFPLPSIDYGASAMAFSPDGSRIAIALGSLVKVADAASGKELLTLSGHSGIVQNIDFSPDGKRIAAGASDSLTILWDAASGQILMTLAGSSKAIDTLKFSPDGARLATSSSDGIARIWDVTPAGAREDLAWYNTQRQPFSGVAFSPNDQQVAASGGGTGGYIWDLTSGKELLHLPGVSSFMGGVAFSPDGKRVAIASGDELVELVDAASGQTLHTLYGHSASIGGLAFSPDGSRLATIAHDNTAVIWDVANGKVLVSVKAYPEALDDTQIVGVAFSPDGSRFATAGGVTPKIWDTSTGKELLALPQQSELVYTVTFSPDGKRLATGLALGQGVIIWDATSGKKLLSLTGHRGSVQGIVFTRDGKQILTGSVDGTVKLWDAITGAELLTLARQPDQITGIALSPDGSRLAAASLDGTVRIYLLRIADLARLARARLTRDLSNEECQKYLHLTQCPKP